MYRIKKDKRVVRSCELISNGLCKCLETKRLDQIDVSELAALSGVSRGTFYRIFDSPVDVLAYTSDTLIDRAFNDYSEKTFKSKDEAALFFLNFWMGNATLLENIQKSGRSELVIKSMKRYSVFYKTKSLKNLSEAEIDYYCAAFAGTLSGLLYVWIQNGRKEDTVELFNTFKKIFHIMHI